MIISRRAILVLSFEIDDFYFAMEYLTPLFHLYIYVPRHLSSSYDIY